MKAKFRIYEAPRANEFSQAVIAVISHARWFFFKNCRLGRRKQVIFYNIAGI